ncbi:hypothetical protein CANINC_004307 [Pichia inconspicua]|uniref:Uncharacterized protein n=1 Tax=Pichia inconspicua TaxID=52247 RepID=A0A4V4NF83_9ASCO|nr:hypothetical protein CANINC_004307 [[Candida] inconspicua]
MTEVAEEKGSNSIENNNEAIEIYKQALTFNVVAKYDPSISQLLHISPYCVIYEYNEETSDWVKSSFMGPLCVYARRSEWDRYDDDHHPKVEVDTVINSSTGSYYRFGLLVLNRGQPENFSIGLLGDDYIIDKDIKDDRGLLIEKNDELIIIKDFNDKTFGLWLFDEKDREYINQLLLFCVDKLK